MFGKKKEEIKESMTNDLPETLPEVKEPQQKEVQEPQPQAEMPLPEKDYIFVSEASVLPNGQFQYLIQSNQKFKLGLLE